MMLISKMVNRLWLLFVEFFKLQASCSNNSTKIVNVFVFKISANQEKDDIFWLAEWNCEIEIVKFNFSILFLIG
jgi:hypothetical protein